MPTSTGSEWISDEFGRGECHALVIRLGEHLRRGNVTLDHPRDGERMLAVRLDAFETTTRKHLPDHIRHAHHQSVHRRSVAI
ncbi:MAG: hypothetical protein ACTHV8_05605 [Nesterenkonia sp.]